MKIKNNIWFNSYNTNKWKLKIIFDLIHIIIINEN